MNPMMSIILPVGENLACLEPTIRSVCAQTNPNWELLAVDFVSRNRYNACLHEWSRRDPRIRLGWVEDNRCPAAARNAALKMAGGEFIAYLDPGDEYNPNHIAEVVVVGEKADVLLFPFDIAYANGPADGRPTQWDPGRVAGRLFAENIVPPLGVVHRRSVLERVGGFNELLWQSEEWELLKRLARSWLRFLNAAHKCGRHSEVVDKANRQRVPTAWQAATLTVNRCAGKPLFTAPNIRAPRRTVERIAFVSPHCLLDFTNGAATATLDQLQLLRRIGFDGQAFCGSQCDAADGTAIGDVLKKQGTPHTITSATSGSAGVPLVRTVHQGVPVTIVDAPAIDPAQPDSPAGRQFLAACDAFLRQARPDVVLTYGGGAMPMAIHRIVKILDIPMIFALHNFGYKKTQTFRAIDYAVVPTEFCRQFYWHTLGLACQKLPLVINPQRVLVRKGNSPHPSPLPSGEGNDPQPSPLPQGEGKFVTFVNPEPRKGVFVFARIAEVLAARYPHPDCGGKAESRKAARIGDRTLRPEEHPRNGEHAGPEALLRGREGALDALGFREFRVRGRRGDVQRNPRRRQQPRRAA